ncbi:MAG: tRNA glutamyl-Q(34) synthetase GluQRS [Haliea sp.]|nr:tRNA glutamyl-Q(34) synthetase GluQRS [Haliea sp.]
MIPCGRFAPSPTGRLHRGSLLAALASFLDMRSRGGRWLLRMEDLDPPREEAGAARAILDCLQAHGLEPDDDVLWQSRRSEAYLAALAQLDRDGHLFACSCSRREQGPEGSCRGNCRIAPPPPDRPAALRVRVPRDYRCQWQDSWQGAQDWPLGAQLSDFVVRRKDGLFAYQLAVVVDDAAQGVTRVVRGADLLDSTPRQRLLQDLLGYPPPAYAHIPVLTAANGQKLSKQNHAPPLDSRRAADNLRDALSLLRQPPPPEHLRQCGEILGHAAAHWTPAAIPCAPSL